MDGGQIYTVENITSGKSFNVRSNLNDREKEVMKKGGLLPYTKGLSSH